MLSGFQLRAARAGIKVTFKELSSITGISLATLKRLEKVGTFEYPEVHNKTLKKLIEFYESCGIVFGEEYSLNIRKPGKI